MSYIPDGANRDYAGRKGIFYAWGWIGDKIPNSDSKWESEEIKQQFLKNLEDIPLIDGYMGLHECEI